MNYYLDLPHVLFLQAPDKQSLSSTQGEPSSTAKYCGYIFMINITALDLMGGAFSLDYIGTNLCI